MRHEAMLWEKRRKNDVKCALCAHRCLIKPGAAGVCGVRRNEGGTLYTCAYGRAIAANTDPVEKKPLYHFLPGSKAFSIATAGCNFKCSYCQNWSISQLGNESGCLPGEDLPPEEVVGRAVRGGCRSISYTYTEPTIFFEYAYDTAVLARQKGLANAFVTNGYMTPEAIDKIAPVLDAANVDLKAFKGSTYADICEARLEPVLESIRLLKKAGIWVEVTTLVVPGLNDSDEELSSIASFIAGVSREIPWHVSRFHPDYQYDAVGATPAATIEKAVNTGRGKGLKYIYPGNMGAVSDTVCPSCGEKLLSRDLFSTEIFPAFGEDGKCGSCGERIPGRWR
ncbi:MAG: AmmeMemoRadiSam system radical SAM enzyme [Candidatus Omnitrophica bacterium]|nr:AmmeMemoRadiSam system radical SAM enzyme [Candidatus Omnitrophota bacterium]